MRPARSGGRSRSPGTARPGARRAARGCRWSTAAPTPRRTAADGARRAPGRAARATCGRRPDFGSPRSASGRGRARARGARSIRGSLTPIVRPGIVPRISSRLLKSPRSRRGSSGGLHHEPPFRSRIELCSRLSSRISRLPRALKRACSDTGPQLDAVLLEHPGGRRGAAAVHAEHRDHGLRPPACSPERRQGASASLPRLVLTPRRRRGETSDLI